MAVPLDILQNCTKCREGMNNKPAKIGVMEYMSPSIDWDPRGPKLEG